MSIAGTSVNISSVFTQCLFPRLTDTLDYQTCARLAQTCRCIADSWAEYVALYDVPQRLARFYRGVALRVLCADPRHDADTPPRVLEVRSGRWDQSAQDSAAIVESVYCGLPARLDELSALVHRGFLEAHMVAELHTISMLHFCEPHRVCATRARQLTEVALRATSDTSNSPSEGSGGWGGGAPRGAPLSVQHGPRVISAVNIVVEAIVGVGALPHMLDADIVASARRGEPQALPPLIQAYCVVMRRVPRLPVELFGHDLVAAEAAVVANRANVAAFQLLYTAASTLFAFRVRPRIRGRVAGIPYVPARVDATDAWRFVVANGISLSLTSPAFDFIIHRDAYARALDGSAPEPSSSSSSRFAHDATLAYAEHTGKYVCAQRYLEQRIRLSPHQLLMPSHVAILDDTAWLSTYIGEHSAAGGAAPTTECRVIQNTLQILWSAAISSGIVIQPPAQCRLPAQLLCEFLPSKDGIVFSASTTKCRTPDSDDTYKLVAVAAKRRRLVTRKFTIVLAIVHRVFAEKNAYTITWSNRALELCDEGATLRCRILEMLSSPRPLEYEALPRCHACGKVLTDAESVARGYGPTCVKKNIK